MQVDTINIFTTPIWKSKLPNFHSIKDQIISSLEDIRMKNEEGVYKSNFNGYRSSDIKHLNELSPLFNHVMNEMVKKAIQDCNLRIRSAAIADSWCLFNDKMNAFNQPHLHYGLFSGIFYVNTPPGSGEIIFLNSGYNDLWSGDSSINNRLFNRINSSEYAITPEEGTIVLWCSYLKHYVIPNHADVRRISISFNVIGNSGDINA